MDNPKMNIPITKPFVGTEEWEAMKEPVESGWLCHGVIGDRFEKNFAARHGVKHALTTTSCTTALHLALATIGVKPGEEVIVPSFTFIASANSIEYTGAKPVFCDVNVDTFNMDPDALEAAITERTAGIMPVHLFGLCADMDRIMAIADAACAVGSAIRDKFAGSFGLFGAFSTHARKLITSGEGGILTTDDDLYARTAWELRSHGGTVSDHERHQKGAFALPTHNRVGFNYRMTGMQEAMLEVQLRKLDKIIALRQAIAASYDAGFADLSEFLVTPHVPEGYFHTYQSYVLRVLRGGPKTRDEIALGLQANGVSVRVGTHAVHDQVVYRERYPNWPNKYPGAYEVDRQSLAIPLFPSMTEEEISYVIEQVRNVVLAREAVTV